jgi:hypothetical protein
MLTRSVYHVIILLTSNPIEYSVRSFQWVVARVSLSFVSHYSTLVTFMTHKITKD